MLSLETLLIEFLGTFLFLSVIVSTSNPIAIGATLAFLIYLAGPISGGHFNPAVTLMMRMKYSLSDIDAVGYVAVQLLGAAAAVCTYTALIPPKMQD